MGPTQLAKEKLGRLCISICDILPKHNNSEPSLKRLATGDEKMDHVQQCGDENVMVTAG